MPLTLNVGLSRKVGEANYGSRGANINLEMELDSAIASEPARLQERFRQLFNLIRTSLNEELSNGHTNGGVDHGPHSNGSGTNGNGASERAATQSQVKAIFAIAKANN